MIPTAQVSIFRFGEANCDGVSLPTACAALTTTPTMGFETEL